MTTLYIVRHGETDNNKAACFNGCKSNQPLNDRGLAQAACLTPAFAGVVLDALYSSPLSRAVATAEAICGSRDLPIQTDSQLREMDMGLYDGVAFDEVRAKDPELMANWNANPEKVRMPGGEAFSDVQTRVTQAVVEIVSQNRGKSVAVVAHGTLLQMFLLNIYGLPFSAKKELPIHYNAAFSELHIEDDGHFAIAAYNRHDHLPEALVRLRPEIRPLELILSRERHYFSDFCK